MVGWYFSSQNLGHRIPFDERASFSFMARLNPLYTFDVESIIHRNLMANPPSKRITIYAMHIARFYAIDVDVSKNSGFSPQIIH